MTAARAAWGHLKLEIIFRNRATGGAKAFRRRTVASQLRNRVDGVLLWAIGAGTVELLKIFASESVVGIDP